MKVYEGKLPYIFISYAHKNDKAVMSVVEVLASRGYRIWFDEGITPGSEWPENIAQHLDASAAVIAFITPEAMASDNCRQEINYSLDLKKPLLPIFLAETKLSSGMRMRLTAYQCIMRYNFRTEEDFLEKVASCPYLQPCRGAVPTQEQPLQQKSEPLPKLRNRLLADKKYLAAAAIGCAVLLAFGAFRWMGSKKAAPEPMFSGTMPPAAAAADPIHAVSEPPTAISTEPAAQPAVEVNVPETTVPAALNEMRTLEKYESLKAEAPSTLTKTKPTTCFWGQNQYKREQVETVQFHGTMEGAPSNAWDLSEAGDRSILAWMDDADLHIAADGKIVCSDATGMFYNFKNLRQIDWGGCLDTAQTTNMFGMFYGCQNIKSLDLSGFDTANVKYMDYMFRNCFNLETLDISSFRTTEVTSMASMFGSCEKLSSIDVSSFDTSHVTTMWRMFGGCSSLTSLDISGFDTSNVLMMSQMFAKCESLTALDLSGWDTSKVVDMTAMFNDCSSLTSLNVSGLNTANVTSMLSMFMKCSSLTELDVSRFDTSKTKEMSNMFFGCCKLKALDVTGFDTSQMVSMSKMFYNCSSLSDLDVSNFDVSKVNQMDDAFRGCSKLSKSSIPDWYKGTV